MKYAFLVAALATETFGGDSSRPRLARSVSAERVARAGARDGVRIGVPLALARAWSGAGIAYSAGETVAYAGAVYVCVQSHHGQPDWSPPAVPALWRRAWRDGAPWTQPLGGHDAYRRGDHVTHAAASWESVADANVWEPGAFGWSNMSAVVSAPSAPTPSAWRPYDGTAATIYQPPARVVYGGKTWVCTAINNVWAPGVYGWEEIR
jgi:hypothetical protein